MNRRKRSLWRDNPRCHWCGVLTMLLSPPSWKDLELHPHVATIDHVYSKFQPSERVRYNNPIVLACHGCNRRRHILESKWLAKQAKLGAF